MNYKFQLLKTSWGIVIFIDIDEMINLPISENDVKVADNIYLRFNPSITIKTSILSFWFSLAIKDLYSEFSHEMKKMTVCYFVKSLDFSYSDFQEEALYYVMQGWLIKKYSLIVPYHDAYYDKENNKYVFPKIQQYLEDGKNI